MIKIIGFDTSKYNHDINKDGGLEVHYSIDGEQRFVQFSQDKFKQLLIDSKIVHSFDNDHEEELANLLGPHEYIESLPFSDFELTDKLVRIIIETHLSNGVMSTKRQ